MKRKIERQFGARLRDDEEIFLEWIIGNIGGHAIILRKNETKDFKTPDIIYNGKLFELKRTSGQISTLDSHLRYSAKQTRGGGTFVDITGSNYALSEAISTSLNRMRRSGLSEVYLIKNWELLCHLTIKITANLAPMRGAPVNG